MGLEKKTKIKICGLFRPVDVEYANLAKPDYVGFILAPGFRRSITAGQAEDFRQKLLPQIQTVGVFVNAPNREVAEYLKKGLIQMAQLHGEETEADIRDIQDRTARPVMKAVKVRRREDAEAWLGSEADFLLFDSGMGTGKTFDWGLLSGIERDFFLAGGLNSENLPEALAVLQPYGVDISSGVETEGLKDGAKMQEAVRLVHGVSLGSEG